MKTIHSNTVQSCVVQNNNTISIQCQALQSEQGVVGLDNNITCLHLVWEDTVGLHKLLAVSIIECLKKVRAHSCATKFTGLVLNKLQSCALCALGFEDRLSHI